MSEKNLIRRIVSSIFLILVILIGVYIDWVFILVILFFTIGGLWEFFSMLEKKGITIYKYFGIVIGMIIPLSIVFRFEPTKAWELLFIVFILLALILMQFKRRENSGVIVGISTTIFGILYVSWFFSFLIRIRYLPDGRGLFLTILLITKLGDIGAYLVGSCFGRRPLIPHISPKKSVEGALGGLVFSGLGALVSRQFLKFDYLHMMMIGIGLGILAQLGDLSESLMKRDCQVKDSGSFFPGMGGFLDLMDSLLFTAPVFYSYMCIVLKK
ncbi:MAG: phosphatidate cytidylyltransferase [Candidatus Omnitrophica bacterium]|nr:phosphatidate cytidylyltransferase [Candidatus Omnitrophota bacterium]